MSHRVSVIIPAWNMARFLPDAIASLPPVHEIFVVVGESDDDTLAVTEGLAANRRDVHLLPVPNRGPAVARNIGLRAATGDVIAFNDADDLWPQGRLALQLARLDAEPRVDVVMGLVGRFSNLDHRDLAPEMSPDVDAKFLHSVGAAIFRRSVFDHIGLFDESLMYAEDGDLLLRIVEADIPFVILKTPTLYYRQHDDSMMTRNDPRKKSDFARALALSLARRRKLGLSLAPVSFDRYFESPQ